MAEVVRPSPRAAAARLFLPTLDLLLAVYVAALALILITGGFDLGIRDPRALQRLQGLRQHLLAHARQRAAQLLKELDSGMPAGLRQRATLAATLSSIGVIQTGLKKFAEAEQSLQEAIAVWRELGDSQPAAPQHHIDRIGAQISLGNLYRDSGRGAEAHRSWQSCLEELEQLRSKHADDSLVGNRVALKVYQLCSIYGLLGEFSLAADCARRNL